MEQILKELENLAAKVEKLTEQVVCMQAQKDFPKEKKTEYFGKE